MKDFQVAILAVDPGITTGFAYFSGFWTGNLQSFVENSFVQSCHLISDSPYHEYLTACFISDFVAKTLNPGSGREPNLVAFVYEDFVLYAGEHSKGAEGLSPVRVTSQVLALLFDRDLYLRCQVAAQMASAAKTEQNKKLFKRVMAEKKLDVPLPHGRDAFWHACSWLRTNEKRLDHAIRG